MSALEDVVARVREDIPIIEFAYGPDWWQFDIPTNLMRWRMPLAPGWSRWNRAKRFIFEKSFNESVIRLVPRGEADNWRLRPGFHCHEGAST